MKKPSAILVAALAAVGINFAASAEVDPNTGVDIEAIKTLLVPSTLADGAVVDAEKGEISYKDGDDKVVIFAGTANQHTLDVVFGVTSIRYLAVAGGGSGGGQAGGGGGAGGMLGGTPESTFTVKTGDKLLINVGAGGQRVSGGVVGKNGFDSAISNDTENVQTQILLAYGGGGGGCYNGSKASAGLEGGSGGGGSSSEVGGNAKDDSAQGHKGGDVKSGSTTKAGAGGGGASEAGAASGSHYDSPRPGKGGIGRKSDITGREVGYAGGGNGGIAAGGATYLPDSNAAYGGGQGGRKSSGYYDGNPGTDGLGGGGGGAASQSGYSSGKGGDGIVIIRFVAPPDTVKATFNYDSEKCMVAANGKSLEGALEYDAPYYAELKVVVTPIVGYKYESAPEGWDLTEDGSITRTYPKEVVVKDFAVEFDAPVEDHDVGELVDVTIDESEHATYEATVDGKPIGDQVEKDSVVVVVATPEEHYAYAELPADWQRVSDTTAITRSFTASEDPTTITIPEPAPIMVTVTVQLIDNVACVVKDGETFVPSGTAVQEGTELKVTVTPQGIYEYSAAPEGWTKNDDGTITLDLTATEETGAIVVPSENFGKRQVTVSFVARGVIYAATNVATKVEVKSGDKLDADAQLEIVATRYSNEYIFADTLPAGWEKADANIIKGVVTAASSIEIPVATWTPTNGELIENGGFEYFDEGEFVEKAAFPASMAGSWVGSINVTYWYKFYGLSKTSPHSGSYSAWTAGNQGNIPYIEVSFTTPTETNDKTEFKLRYFIMQISTGLDYDGQCRLQLYQGAKEVKDFGTVESTLNSWEERTQIISDLKPSTTYTLRFGRYGVNYHNYAIDDVSLKMRPKKGLALLIY